MRQRVVAALVDHLRVLVVTLVDHVVLSQVRIVRMMYLHVLALGSVVMTVI